MTIATKLVKPVTPSKGLENSFFVVMSIFAAIIVIMSMVNGVDLMTSGPVHVNDDLVGHLEVIQNRNQGIAMILDGWLHGSVLFGLALLVKNSKR